jgi:hypothetical protein
MTEIRSTISKYRNRVLYLYKLLFLFRDILHILLYYVGYVWRSVRYTKLHIVVHVLAVLGAVHIPWAVIVRACGLVVCDTLSYVDIIPEFTGPLSIRLSLLLWPIPLLSTVSNWASSRQPIIRRWLICLFMNDRVLDPSNKNSHLMQKCVFFSYLLHAAFDVVQKRWVNRSSF